MAAIQKATVTNSGSSASGTLTVSAGNILVVSGVCYQRGTLSVSDNRSNSYNLTYYDFGSADNGSRIFIAFASNIPSGSTTATVSATGFGGGIKSTLMESAGGGTPISIDTYNTSQASNSSSVSVTTTANNELLIAVAAVGEFGASITISGSGWTSEYAAVGGVGDAVAVWDKVLTSLGTETDTMTNTSFNTPNLGAMMMALQPTVAAPLLMQFSMPT